MRKRLENVRRALRGNSGSGIVLVLVCMLCVSILGVMVMYLSYTGLLLKVTERQSKADFYDASTAMDEIRAGVQKYASDAIAGAYKTVLINYNYPDFIPTGSTMEEQFKSEFKSNILKSDLFSAGKYSLTALEGMTGTGASVTGSGLFDTAADAIVLKNVAVTYTDSKNYTTTVSSDISIGMPEFSYVVSNYSVSNLPSFALIAQDKLQAGTSDNTLGVVGSAYAGSVQADNPLTFNGGTVVCKGLITVNSDGAHPSALTAADSTTLWANRIKVGASSSLTLKGNTYVQDDLDLTGINATAALSGGYYGFGVSTTKSTESSAIRVNATGTTLNLSGLTRLMLAGHSFVSDPTGEGSTDVLMGESISVRGDQWAYLIPSKYLNGVSSNPRIYSGSTPAVPSLTGTGDMELGQKYGVTVKQVITNYPGTEQHIAYYFMQFSSADNANSFFKDYFTGNPKEIIGYLKEYSALTSATGTTQSAGYTLKSATDSSGNYSLGSIYSGSFETSSKQMTSTFNQLTTTLFARKSGNVDNPYEYFVNGTKLREAVPTGLVMSFQNGSGDTVGIVSNGAYRIDEHSPEKLCIVIAEGDVTVDREFHGIIISGVKPEDNIGGNIILHSPVIADEANVTAALAAKSGQYTLSDFLQNGAANTSSTSGGSNSGWNLGDLITYRNWKKD